MGLRVKSIHAEYVAKSEVMSEKYPQPSRIDLLALALAMQEQCPLLTGDRDLRKAAVAEGVEVHRTIWLVEEMLKEKLIHTSMARAAFQKMKDGGSRLPWGDIEKVFSRL